MKRRSNKSFIMERNLKSLCYKETYLEPSQASKIEFYAKIVNGWKRRYSENASGIFQKLSTMKTCIKIITRERSNNSATNVDN